MDDLVVPLVDYFNSCGLKTVMSCQGHNDTNMSMFWIQFHDSVKKDDILRFMEHHLDSYGNFCCNGRFARRMVGFKHKLTGEMISEDSWNYFAATPSAANDDLNRWTQKT